MGVMGDNADQGPQSQPVWGMLSPVAEPAGGRGASGEGDRRRSVRPSPGPHAVARAMEGRRPARRERNLPIRRPLRHRMLHTHTHTHTDTRAHARTHARTHTHTHTHAYTRTRTHTHARTHARTQAHMYAHVRTHARTHARSTAHCVPRGNTTWPSCIVKKRWEEATQTRLGREAEASGGSFMYYTQTRLSRVAKARGGTYAASVRTLQTAPFSELLALLAFASHFLS